jgi:putative zinc finger/helix-turn-helix YgiT family protein
MPPTMKPPPWKCGTCRERSVVPAVIPYEAEVEHDGRSYTIAFPDLGVLRCERCGTIVLPDAANQRISQALRRQAGLLTPEEIQTDREALGLTQQQLAVYLGVAEETLSRWETGAQIQQRALDRFLRVILSFPSVRAALASEQLSSSTPPLAPTT